ncbi:unnamed protein product [Ceutorhynchus assimilis]|uniref:C2H2-type domain-containing protein n=1 Tax=Ceutorhynchus assimilis TaxID=467358 RepID=A0A9N9QRW3_9CUCU|nr:unnamed protein product [Ceutorhynchus assimilis]
MDDQLFTETEMFNFQCLLARMSNNGRYRLEKNPESDPVIFPRAAQHLGTASTNNNMGFQNLQGIARYHLPAATVTSQEPVKDQRIYDKIYHKYKNVNGENIKVFECPICQKECTHQYTLNRHLNTHLTERNYCCSTCGKAFRQMSTLTQHKAIHSSKRPHVCEVCHKTFNRVSTLISHKKTHTGIKPHQCHLCPKAFHQKGNLRNHIFTHTGERPYKCDICNKGFNQKSNLTCHKSQAHQDQNHLLPQYNCEICDASFSKRSEMRSHEQLEHDTAGPQDLNGAVRVDPIKTDAMRAALAAGRTPFALLRPLSGVPVLVRVHPDGDKQMLLPATAEDLKRFGTISTTAKTVGQDSSSAKGRIVGIWVPVVATVIQTSNDKNAALTVQSPGQAGDILGARGGEMTDPNVNSYVYIASMLENIEDLTDGNFPNLSQLNFNPALFDNYDIESLSMDNMKSGNVAQDIEVVENEMPDCKVESSAKDNSYGGELNLAAFNCSEFIDAKLLEGGEDYSILPFN